jgi:hypothetical protein
MSPQWRHRPKVGAGGTVNPQAGTRLSVKANGSAANVKRSGRNQKSALMKQLRYRAVEQTTLSSP